MELKLSKIVDDQEQKWKNESETLISSIIKNNFKEKGELVNVI